MRKTSKILSPIINDDEINVYSNIIKLDMVETIYSIFYISMKDGININYARIHSEFMQDLNSGNKNNSNFLVDKKRKIIHKLLSIGYSINAKTGEYYPFIINYNSILYCKKKYSIIWDILDKNIRKIIHKNKINTYFEIQFPTTKLQKYEKIIKTSINNTGLETDILIINFFICIYSVINKVNLTNINNNYYFIFFKYLLSDISNMGYELKNINNRDLDDMFFYCTKFMTSEHKYASIGEKLIPLYLSHAKNPLNIYHNSWKNLIILSNVCDLVTNNISINFPLFSCWLYIRNINKLIFNSEFLHTKIKKSVEILSVIDFLKKAENKIQLMYSDNQQNILIEQVLKNLLSNKFNITKNKIDDILKYIQNNLLLSEVILSVIFENSGDILKHKKNHFNSCLIDIFYKHIFEIIYSIMCLHNKLGILHGDLYLRNITINNKYNSHYKNIDYALNKKNIFSFSSKGGNINIIDFDQSIIGLNKSNNLLKHIKIYDIKNTTIDTCFYDNMIKDLFPENLNLQKKLKEFSIIHNSEFMNFMVVFELYKIILIIKKLVSDKKKLELLNNILKYADNILNNILISSLNNDNINKYNSTRNFLQEIILNNFAHYKIKKSKSNSIVCNFDKNIKYSISNFPFMKKDWTNKNSEFYFNEMKKKYKIIDPIIPNRHSEKYI